MKSLIRYLSYPLIAGGGLLLLSSLAAQGLPYWPTFPLVVIAGVAVVAVLERFSPYQPEWNKDQDDTAVDVIHILVTQTLLQTSVAAAFALRQHLGDTPLWWPVSLPVWMQILLAGAIMDFWLYLMHRASHISGFLWRLHALHHSPERLYWLNGGRRHPLSAIVLAGPGMFTLLVLGATPIAVGAWLSFMSIHLAFQHANLDYSLGPLRRWLGVAEMHRWHHKREFEDAQVNFGEVFLIWDGLFGTLHHAERSPRAGEVGLREETMPKSYLRQLSWPFTKASRTSH